jgi:hypothetical protein
LLDGSGVQGPGITQLLPESRELFTLLASVLSRNLTHYLPALPAPFCVFRRT